MKKIIIALVIILVLAGGGFAIYKLFIAKPATIEQVNQPVTTAPVVTPTPEPTPAVSAETNDNLDIAIDELGAIPQ